MGSTTNINATIMAEKSRICQRLEGKNTYATRVKRNCIHLREFVAQIA
jgi:hypothetical protein